MQGHAIVTDITDASLEHQKPRFVGREKLEIPRKDENGPWYPQDSTVLNPFELLLLLGLASTQSFWSWYP